MPAVEIVPTLELPPAIPLTVQVTAVFDVPVTLAVNCCVCPRNTEAVEGVTLAVTPGGGGAAGAEVVLAQLTSDISKISATPKHPAACHTCILGVFIAIAFASVEPSFASAATLDANARTVPNRGTRLCAERPPGLGPMVLRGNLH